MRRLRKTFQSNSGVSYQTNETYSINEQYAIRDFGAMDVDHAEWMHRNSPEGWSSEQWAEYEAMVKARGLGFQSAKDRFARRHEWAEQRVRELCEGRTVSHAMRIQMRRDANREAVILFGRHLPSLDGN